MQNLSCEICGTKVNGDNLELIKIDGCVYLSSTLELLKLQNQCDIFVLKKVMV